MIYEQSSNQNNDCKKSHRDLMCVGRYAEKMQWSEAKWNLFEMPAIDMSILCIPAECDNIK